MEVSQKDAIIQEEEPNKQENRSLTSIHWQEKNYLDFENINNKKILNNLYGKEIFSIMEKLSTLKDNSKTFIERTTEELNAKYDIFNSEILKYINITTNKVINAFQFDISNMDEEKSKLVHDFSTEKINILKKLLSLHKQIIEVIQQNFLILENFLQIFELMDKEHPIQEFFTKEFDNIIKSWLFLKLDLEKFNFKNIINDSNLNQNYKDFILKECQGKNSVMNIILTEQEMNDFKKNSNIKEKKKNYIRQYESFRKVKYDKCSKYRLLFRKIKI